MKVVKIQFHKLDKEYFFLPEFSDDRGADIKVGDLVIVQTVLGEDMGVISGWTDFEPNAQSDNQENGKNLGIIEQRSISDIKPMLRRANEKDLKKAAEQGKEFSKYLHDCKQLTKKYDLTEMKIIDVN